MPRQARCPRSGWGRASRICSQRAAVAGRSFGRLPECARSSSRHSADGWKACAREWWCASGSRLPLCGRRCARPCGGSRRRGRSAALRPQRGRSGRGRSNSGRRCRRDSRCRPGQTPLAIFVGLAWQRLERRPIDLLEQLAASDAEPAKALLVIELRHELAKRGVAVGETACSTFALSRGFLGLAGRMAVP